MFKYPSADTVGTCCCGVLYYSKWAVNNMKISFIIYVAATHPHFERNTGHKTSPRGKSHVTSVFYDCIMCRYQASGGRVFQQTNFPRAPLSFRIFLFPNR